MLIKIQNVVLLSTHHTLSLVCSMLYGMLCIGSMVGRLSEGVVRLDPRARAPRGTPLMGDAVVAEARPTVEGDVAIFVNTWTKTSDADIPGGE